MVENELRAILSANLKRYRNYRKFTQEEMAEKLKISIPFLSDVENGRKWVSPATLVKLADVLGIEPHELFKPEQNLSPAMKLTLDKWSDEVIDAVTKTVKNIQKYYITGKEGHAEAKGTRAKTKK
jgi:transcriptional regulator with XRE-family HTH domain